MASNNEPPFQRLGKCFLSNYIQNRIRIEYHLLLSLPFKGIKANTQNREANTFIHIHTQQNKCFMSRVLRAMLSNIYM